MSTGSGMLAVEDVEAYFAKSALFRARGGDADETTAKKRIYYGETELPASQAGATLAPLRPYVTLIPDRLAYKAAGVGQTTILHADGGVFAIITDNPKNGANYKESFRDYWDWVTSVTDQIAAMHRTDDHFRFEIMLAVGPWRPALTERAPDDFWECALVFAYATDN